MKNAKHWPSIALITPSFNQGHFIARTIESVLSQNYPNLDYVVMDGGSTDNTIEILRRYGDRVRWVSKKDNGQTDAINQGIRLTKGEIVGYLNSDDILAPGALQRVALEFMRQPKTIWLSGDYAHIDQRGRHKFDPIPTYKKLQRQIGSLVPILWPAILGINNPLAQPSTFWRRSVHEKLGYLDEKLRYTMDYDWWLRLLTLVPPMIISDRLSLFRLHAESKGGLQFERQFAQQLAVAHARQVRPPWLWLQRLHNQLICWVYSRR